MQFIFALISSALAVPHASPAAEPSFLDDISSVVTGGSAVSDTLDSLKDVASEVKNAATGAWDLNVDGCLAVQCAVALSPVTLTCVISLINEKPLQCFEGIVGSMGQDACDGCPEAVEEYIKSQIK